MRETMSITAIFQIFILFILLFTAIMCLTINNSNAFGVKDSIINVIEANEGLYLDGGNLSQEIVDVIAETSYRTSGKCPEVYDYSGALSENQYQGFDRNGNALTSDSSNAAVCIRRVNVTDEFDEYLLNHTGLGGKVATEDFIEGYYYQIVVFFQLDIPVIKQVFDFQTKGETRIIYGSVA